MKTCSVTLSIFSNSHHLTKLKAAEREVMSVNECNIQVIQNYTIEKQYFISFFFSYPKDKLLNCLEKHNQSIAELRRNITSQMKHNQSTGKQICKWYLNARIKTKKNWFHNDTTCSGITTQQANVLYTKWEANKTRIHSRQHTDGMLT